MRLSFGRFGEGRRAAPAMSSAQLVPRSAAEDLSLRQASTHTHPIDDDGIIMARSNRLDLRMTGDSPVTACMPPEGRDCTWRRGVAKQGGRQGGLHEEAAHHRAGESNRTCAHPVQLLKQNPVQAHKRAQPRRGWRAVDRRAGGCAQNSGHVCSLVTRHRSRA